MKKYIYAALIALGAIAMSGCKQVSEGTDAGSDSKALVTPYLFAPKGSPGEGQPPYNSDEDVSIRFVSNNKVAEFYYYIELLSDKDAFIEENGADAYNDYVIANGDKIDEDLDKDPEVIVTGLPGTYAISIVALNSGGKKNASEAIFYGLTWTTLATGTYNYQITNLLGYTPATATIELQQCDTDENLFRFKDLYGVGYSLKLTALPDYTAVDAGSTFVYCRIAPQNTPFVHSTRGNVSVRDIGYWQGDIGFITDGGYESGICIDGPDLNFAYISPQYYGPGGSIGYGFRGNAYLEIFEPND